MENKYENINDRLTAISNQNKCSQQTTTDTLNVITNEINVLKSDVDRKTSNILSKTDFLMDKMKQTADLVNKIPACENTNNKSKHTNTAKVNNEKTKQVTVTETNQPAETIVIPDDEQNHSNNKRNEKPPPKRDLTFITGSCILKGIDAKFLDRNVRVKSFREAKIENLHESLLKMDLSRYKNIIIHIGGHDVDSKISLQSFREKYQSLLDFLKSVGCKLFVSGLLPRGGTDMQKFNDTLKEMCLQNNVKFINNHNSFIMASGELPFDFFHADQVSLKFPGIRKLVHNINDSCQVLPREKNLRPLKPNGHHGRSRYPRNNIAYKN